MDNRSSSVTDCSSKPISITPSPSCTRSRYLSPEGVAAGGVQQFVSGNLSYRIWLSCGQRNQPICTDGALGGEIPSGSLNRGYDEVRGYVRKMYFASGWRPYDIAVHLGVRLEQVCDWLK